MPKSEASDESMRDLVMQIALALVDDPESVAVDVEQSEASTVLTLTVAPTDAGKVIGKQGRTARSIRTVLAAASMKLGRRYALDIPVTKAQLSAV